MSSGRIAGHVEPDIALSMAIQGCNPALERESSSTATSSQTTSANGSTDRIKRTGSVGDIEKRDLRPRDLLSGGDVHFKTMAWWHVGILMIAETISLGILSLPWTLSVIGFIPGLLLITGFGLVATYAGYIIGQFKLRYPQVLSVADAAAVLCENISPRHNSGAWAYRIFGVASVFFLIFVMAAHILTFGIMMNVLTDHGTCTIIFAVIGTVVSFILTLPRTLKNISYMSIASFISILLAVAVALISISAQHKGKPQPSPIIVKGAAFSTSMVAIMQIIMSYAGNIAYYNFISELKHPEHFPRALAFVQITTITVYALAAALIYTYYGIGVPTPALNAASPLFRKIGWALALPTILIAGVINGSVAVKYVFVVFKGSLITSKSRVAHAWWVGLNLVIWTVAWVLAESIPDFENLVSLVAAMLGSLFTYGVPGWLWLSMNWRRIGKGAGWRIWALTATSVALCTLGVVACGLGTWASMNDIAKSSGGKAWSCADNSQKHH